MKAIFADMGNGRQKFGAAVFKRIGAFVLAMIFSVFAFANVRCAQGESNGMLRVRLTRLGTPSSITMQADCAYVLSGDYPMNLPSGTRFNVSASGGILTFSCNGISVEAPSGTKLLRVGSGTSGIKFISPSLSNVFCGDLILYASGSAITAVLEIYLETYLYGVVPYEMSNSYPLQALKAQAIVARNYAVKKMGGSAKTYHISDTTADQVFKGYNAGYALAHQAVNETRGMLLYSGGSVAFCYYSASNGGQTESTKNAWGGSLSYSVVKDDPYDLENASSKKKTAAISKDASDLNASLESALIESVRDRFIALDADPSSIEITQINQITAINPRYASPSRLYRTLRFDFSARAKNDLTYVSLNESADVATYGGIESWYGLSINSADNETVWVEEKADSFIITFRRYGHGIGMSQRGAQTMAGAYGMNYREILDFYYSGTSIKTVSLGEAVAHSVSVLPDGAIASAQIGSNAALYDAADGAKVGTIASGKSVSVYQIDGAWAKIGLGGLCAWVETKYFENFTLANDSLEAFAAAQSAALNAETVLRELPFETSQSIALLPAGSVVTVYRQNSDWAWVTAQDGLCGYIAVSSLDPTATPEPTSTPQPTQEIATDEPLVTNAPTQTIPNDEPTATPNGTPAITPLPTVAPTQKPSETKHPNALPMQPIPVDATLEPPQAPEGAEDMLIVTEDIYLYVNVKSGSTLTLRGRPSENSEALAYLNRGTKIKLLAFDDDWACISDENDRQGFAAIRYLSENYIQPDAMLQPDNSGSDMRSEWMREFTRIDTDVVFCNRIAKTLYSAKLYRSASAASEALGTIPVGMQFSVLAYNDEWAYVSRKGISGYVKLKYITLVS